MVDIEGGGVRWNVTKDKPVEIAIEAISVGCFKKALKNLEDTDKLQDAHLDLYKIFVDGKTPE
jgi:hypothetical protein